MKLTTTALHTSRNLLKRLARNMEIVHAFLSTSTCILSWAARFFLYSPKNYAICALCTGSTLACKKCTELFNHQQVNMTKLKLWWNSTKKTHNKARINTKPLNAIQWRHKLASNILSAGKLKKETVFSMSEWIIASDKMMLEPVKEMLAVTWRHLNISCSDASIGLFLKVQRTETINPKRNTCGLLFFISSVSMRYVRSCNLHCFCCDFDFGGKEKLWAESMTKKR